MKTKQLLTLAILLLGVTLVREAQAFYNPSTGRWLNRDPIGEQGGLNLYAFVRNGPVGNIDLLGRDCLDPCRTAVALGIAPRPSSKLEGGLVCCGGKLYACAFSIGAFSGKVKEIVESCIMQHEARHFNDVAECPMCDQWPSRPPWKVPVDSKGAECNAWNSTTACFQDAINRNACGEDWLCKRQLEIAYDIAKDEADKQCAQRNK